MKNNYFQNDKSLVGKVALNYIFANLINVCLNKTVSHFCFCIYPSVICCFR